MGRSELSIGAIASPVRGQSDGVLNSPAIIMTTGSFGAFAANQAGGRYTNSVRCLKPDARRGWSPAPAPRARERPYPASPSRCSDRSRRAVAPRSTRSTPPERSGSSRPTDSAIRPHSAGTTAPPAVTPTDATTGCRANRAPRRPTLCPSGPPKSTATTARDRRRAPENRCTSAPRPPGSDRRRAQPAAISDATVAIASQSPPPAPRLPPPISSAAAIRAAAIAHRGIRHSLELPRLTLLSHRHIHQQSCELAVSGLTIRRRPQPPM